MNEAWIAPCFRSRRAVSNGGTHLSVAYDSTCFMRFFELYKLCLKSASMKLWIAPCFRSRRAVSHGGLLLSVAFDLTSSVTFFGFMDACMDVCMDACIHENPKSLSIRSNRKLETKENHHSTQLSNNVHTFQKTL